MVVLLVALGVLILASGVDLGLPWDTKSHGGLLVVFLVSSHPETPSFDLSVVKSGF